MVLVYCHQREFAISISLHLVDFEAIPVTMRNLRGLRKYSKRCSKSRTKLAEPNALLLLAASFVLLLGGCLGYPISQDTQEYSINGDVAGVKSNPDEKVIVVSTAYSTQ